MDAHDALLEELRKWQEGADAVVNATPTPGEESSPDSGSRMASGPPSGFRDAILQAAMGAAKPSQMAPPPAAPKQIEAPQPHLAPAQADDSELRAAQEADASSRRMGRLGKAVTAITEVPDAFLSRMTGRGSGGAAPMAHNDMWDEQAKSGEGAVAALMARRKSESEMAARQAAAKKAAEAKDPNSETARVYRSVLTKFSPGLQLEGATPEQMEKIAPWLEKFAAENGDTLRAQASAQAKAAEEKKKATEAAAELSSWKDVMKKRYPASAAEIDSLTTMKAANDYQSALEGDRTRASNERAAQAHAAAARSDKAAEEVKKGLEDVPPGYEVSSGAHPSAESRKKFAALVTSGEKMKGLTQQMREAMEGTSSFSRVMDPGTRSKLKQIATQMQIEAKNVAELGALSGPDQKLMEAMAADPTGFWNNLTIDFPTMLGQLDKWSENTIAAGSHGTGIVKSGAVSGAPKTIEIVDKKGQHYRPPPEDAEALRAELRAEGLL